jgi:hypothetical protein
MTILQIVQEQIAPKIGITIPDAVYGAGVDREIIELRGTIRDTIADICFNRDSHEWQRLKTTATLVGTGSTNSFSLPDDFNRFTKPAALWSSRLQRFITHIDDSSQWLGMKERNVGLTIGAWHVIGNQIEIYPTPESGEEYKFVYVSNYVDAGLSKMKTLDDDNDEFRLDEQLLAQGVVWRWRSNKGLPYAEYLEDYNSTYAGLVAEDGGSSILRPGSRPIDVAIDKTYHGQTIIDTR